MKRACFLLLALVAASSSLRAAPTDNEVEAHKIALELAGAFSNDGFKIRDGHWAGQLSKNTRQLVAVNLYAGNQYWFSAGAAGAKNFAVHLFDETGQPLATENFADEEKAAAGFAPTTSGQYFVQIDPQDVDGATFCLVYSYK